jgi:hypothetical protein
MPNMDMSEYTRIRKLTVIGAATSAADPRKFRALTRFDSINPATLIRKPNGAVCIDGCGTDPKPHSLFAVNKYKADQVPHFRFNESMSSNFDWVQRSTPTGLTPRLQPGMTYDSDRKKIVMFGGNTDEDTDGNLIFTDEVWEYDGTWTQRPTSDGPTPRMIPNMAYDSDRKKIVMFGGSNDAENEKTIVNEMWEYNGTTSTWTQLESPPITSVILYSFMVYDSYRKKIVLLLYCRVTLPNGQTEGIVETWEYDETWEQKTLPNGIDFDAEIGSDIVYDSDRKKTILVIGVLGETFETTTLETWEYDGTWSNQSFISLPISLFSLAYDSNRKKIILLGLGPNPDPNIFPPVSIQTWEYDETWIQQLTPNNPPIQPIPVMAYDSNRKQLVTFGGFMGDFSTEFVNDTWEYGNV